MLKCIKNRDRQTVGQYGPKGDLLFIVTLPWRTLGAVPSSRSGCHQGLRLKWGQKVFRDSRRQECGLLLGKARGLSGARGEGQGLPAGGLCWRALGWPPEPSGPCPSQGEPGGWMGMELSY